MGRTPNLGRVRVIRCVPAAYSTGRNASTRAVGKGPAITAAANANHGADEETAVGRAGATAGGVMRRDRLDGYVGRRCPSAELVGHAVRRIASEPHRPAGWQASGALGRPGVVPRVLPATPRARRCPRPRLWAWTYSERRRLSGAGRLASTQGVREEDAASACMDACMNRAAVTTRSLDTGHARDPLPEPTRLLSVGDVCRALQCGRTFVYELLQKWELHAIKLGRLTRISPAGLDDFIVRQERASGDAPISTADVRSGRASRVSARPSAFHRTYGSGRRRFAK